MAQPALRATGEDGSTYDDPSEHLLFILVTDIEEERSEFLIVERAADASGPTYTQTACNDDGSYIVERQEGSLDRHYETIASDRHEAHRILTGWSFAMPGWGPRPHLDKVRHHLLEPDPAS